MKILIITQKFNNQDPILGFFTRWVDEFAKEYDEVKVIAKEIGGHHLLPSNVHVFGLGKSEGVGRFGQLINFWRILSTEKYDRVFVHMNPEYVILAGWWWKLKNLPVALWYTHKATPWQLKLAIPWVKWIFTASRESFRLPSKKVIVTGHGIDPMSFIKNKNVDLTKMLAVGRITPTKDYETMIKTLKLLGGNYTLDIIGEPVLQEDKAYDTSLKEMVQTSGLANQVHFLGALPYDRLIKKYNEYGVMLHASGTGSLDKVVLEAILAGVVPISSSEAFTNLDSQLRFEANNPRDLADKIIGLSKVNVQEMQNKLIDWVSENHNLDKLIIKISKYLNN